MGVNLRGLEILVAQQFLKGMNIATLQENLRGEAVPKTVANSTLDDARP